ncbi:hypothetical protein FJZ28_04315 [Candidatus Peregrinibacteria bacterium]|nr:hypothetical protein [Candidatus Peregrinibacteria bacterium]
MIPPEDIRRRIVTPHVIETLLDAYEVPDQQRQTLRDIIELCLVHGDDPKVFAKHAREYTVTRNLPADVARTTLLVFSSMRANMDTLFQKAAESN